MKKIKWAAVALGAFAAVVLLLVAFMAARAKDGAQ
jgi:hypothetical protein